MTPTLTFRQLEAPRPEGKPRTLVLRGSAAPVDHIKWGVAQRYSLRHYPGSGEAAAFLDGPEERAVDLQFDWKSRRLDPLDMRLDDAALANADILVETLEDFCRDQVLVEMSWRERILVGFFAEFIPVEGWESEYTATLTFQPTQSPRWERSQPSLETPPGSLYEGMWGSWQEDTQDREPPISATRKTLETVETSLDGLNQTFGRFETLTQELELTGATAVQVYRGVGEVLSTLVTQGANVRDAVVVPAGVMAQTDDPLTQMKAAAFQRSLGRGAQRVRQRSAVERLYYRSLERRDLVGVHVVAAGETIWSIAWRWYGTTEAWRLIANRNALATTSPLVGTKLFIPKRESA